MVDQEFESWARARMPGLMRAAYLLTGNQQQAQDLTQTSLERVCIAWRRISTSPDAYVRVVMHREHLAKWRRPRLRELVTSSPPDPGGADATSSVETRLVLQAALGKLTPAQRSVLVLRYYEDLSEADTAVALGCSVGTVKSQTHKAIRALLRSEPGLADLVGRRLPTDV